jgi:nickel-dependent lactate racemase
MNTQTGETRIDSDSLLGRGYKDQAMTDGEAMAIMAEALERWDLANQRVLVLFPDGTRTAPIPLLFRQICDSLYGRAVSLDVLITLGTHRKMSPEALERHLGMSQEERLRRYPEVGIYQHDWKDERSLAELGAVPLAELHESSGGVLPAQARLAVNRRLLEADVLLICGPVFPHEVLGYSGGSAYLFPGASSVEILDVIHMIEGLLTSSQVIGRKWTPARRLLDAALERIPTRVLAAHLVVVPEGQPSPAGLVGLYTGEVKPSWSAAADLSSQVNVHYVDQPVRKALSIMPKMYEDLWTGGKGMFKLDPAISDGGEVTIYAPHIAELSFAYGHILRQIGYHVMPYFTKQWNRFKQHPIGVLSHSAEVVGSGTYETEVETRRVRLRMATGLSRELCRQVSLEYLDPAVVRPEEYAGQEAEGVLLVPKAGEILYQLSSRRDLYEVPLEFPGAD